MFRKDPVRKRKTSSPLPAFETEDVSLACSNNNKARRRRSNENSPLPTGTPPLNEHVELLRVSSRFLIRL
jgi:hypothetical protein